MRNLLGVGLALVALVGCGSHTAARSLEGKAPAGATDIYAIDAQGRTAHADATSGAFTLALEPGAPVVAFVATADGTVAPLMFDADQSGTRSSVIPDFAGAVSLGQVSIVDLTAQRNGNGTVEAESEQNPLDQVDSDADGQSDLADADDDNDGVPDSQDADSDGNGTDDTSEDMDSDEDGLPDAADSDANGDGVEDGADTGSGDTASDTGGDTGSDTDSDTDTDTGA